MSLDRIDNDRNYSCGECEECTEFFWPQNVRWATPKQQCRNRRSNHLLTFNNKTQTITEWAEELGLTQNILYYRVNTLKMSAEQALSTPRLRKRR